MAIVPPNVATPSKSVIDERVGTPMNRAIRLQSALAQEDPTDPFRLAREYANQCERNQDGHLTLR